MNTCILKVPIDLLLLITYDIMHVARYYYPDNFSLPTADLSHCAEGDHVWNQ